MRPQTDLNNPSWMADGMLAEGVTVPDPFESTEALCEMVLEDKHCSQEQLTVRCDYLDGLRM